MHSGTPQLTVSRVFDAPRALVFRAFTDPDQLASWWGPSDNTLPRDEIEFDVRPGGYQRWTEVAAADPDLRVHVHIDLTDVADGDVLEGVMHVSGRLPPGVEPFETKFRFEFHDESDGRTRLEIRQWLPAHLTEPSHRGWLEAFEKLDTTLLDLQAATTTLLRSFGTFLYGRRLYESMALWETDPALAEQSDLTADFASVWQAADKVVYSTTLTDVSTAATRLERDFDPAAVQELKADATSDLSIGGANLAAQALAAGLVDQCQLFVWPVIVGGGKPALPAGIRTDLELLDERRFDNGVIHLRYRIPT